MKNVAKMVTLLGVAAGVLLGAEAVAQTPFVFRDVAPETGLLKLVEGVQAHAAGWGDIDGDGQLDLYVGTFARTDGKANLLARYVGGKFVLDGQEQLRVRGRCNSGLLADFDNDGDLDLYVASMPTTKDPSVSASVLFRNDGKGRFSNVSAGNAPCGDFGARSAAVLDFDGDGLLDLLVGEDPFGVYSKTKSSRLFRNLGGFKFADVSRDVGLPADVPGLGVAVGDLTGDGWPDFVLSARFGGNRVFVNDGRGKFNEAIGCREVLDWSVTAKPSANDDSSAGVCLGDVNRDGRLDVVIGQHYKRPWLQPVSLRLYLNGGLRDGQPTFDDVTETCGLTPLPMKAPHVEIQDFDNDGWPDIYTSVLKYSEQDKQPHPLIYRQVGQKDGVPQFRESVMSVNDFPTATDRAETKTGAFWDKVAREGKVMYFAPGPTADFDQDGRLDIFMGNWWVEAPSVLLKNETPSGRWLQFRSTGFDGDNRMGIGTVFRVYRTGKLGDASALLAHSEIATGYGYVSNQPAIAHVGVGLEERVDVEVMRPHGKGRLELKSIETAARLSVPKK